MKCCGGFICSQCVWKVQELTFGVFLHFNSQIKESTVRLLLSRSGVVQRQNLNTAARLFTLYTYCYLTVDYKRSWTLTERVADPDPLAVTLKSLFISTYQSNQIHNIIEICKDLIVHQVKLMDDEQLNSHNITKTQLTWAANNLNLVDELLLTLSERVRCALSLLILHLTGLLLPCTASSTSRLKFCLSFTCMRYSATAWNTMMVA